MRIKVQVSSIDGIRTYTEDVTPHVANLEGFPSWIEPLNLFASHLYNYRNKHFVFDWFSLYSKSMNVPSWMIYEKELKIQVIHEN